MPGSPPRLDELGGALSQHGITAVTDATPQVGRDYVEHVRRSVATGAPPVGVCLLGAAEAIPPGPGLSHGPAKILIPESDLPELGPLVDAIASHHAVNRSVSIHCVSEEAYLLAGAAWREAGVRPGDRFEHGALLPAYVLDELAAEGITIVTQPGFLADRGDVGS
ncbi:MAG: nfdA 3 [Subtercola sp.]|nr:nfdA 3 [Subtercola sp.]